MLNLPIADTDAAACASFFPLYTPSALRRQSLPRSTPDDRRSFLGDHDRRRIGVGRGHRRHHRGVDDPQPLEPVHLELVVDDRHGVAPHHASAARVITGAAIAPRIVEQFVVALDLVAGQSLFADELLQWWCCEDLSRRSQPADDDTWRRSSDRERESGQTVGLA